MWRSRVPAKQHRYTELSYSMKNSRFNMLFILNKPDRTKDFARSFRRFSISVAKKKKTSTVAQ